MLSSLKFVQGAIAKKDYVPALTHFHIGDGFVRGYNGRIALCGPINLDLNVNPLAVPFVKAIEACTKTITLSRSSNGKLYIKSGSFKAFINCSEEEYPDIEPSGTIIPITQPIIAPLKILEPFIAKDASRPWARGILFRGQSVYATNNIVLIEIWTGYNFPVEVIVPHAAVVELIRIKEEPEAIQVCSNSITFHFEGKRWLKAQLQTDTWPDVTKILEQESNQSPLPEEIFTALETIKPFVEDTGRAYLVDGRVSTSAESAEGASVEVDGAVGPACFNLQQLMALRGIAKTIDFSSYPAACIFYGNKLRGALIGIRI